MKLKTLKFHIAFFTLALLMAMPCHAMTLDAALDVVQNKYRSLSTLSATFVQSTKLKLLNKTVKTTGTLSLKKPGKLRIAYDDANAKNYISDGKTLWVVDKATQQTDKFKIGSSEIPKEALTFLNGFGDIRETFGVATWDVTKKGLIEFQLVPEKPTTYTALDTTFSADGILQNLTIHNRSGNVSHYEFSQTVENAPLSDSLFRP